ncbi:NAD-dependent dehydratase [Noviherbaspirillum sp.]|uniref:NAD-dependent dehydratase n=1 Tax=Noviherbaspirillum sp. TaxID=1926288 RepID=UPI002FDFB227
MTSLLIVGATGLVGQSVLELAKSDPRIHSIVAPTRHALPVHAKLQNPVVDFDRLPHDASWWHVDAAICTLGTTMRDAGSRDAFRKVDFEYPVAVANHVRRHGATAFALNSAMGADAGSRIFYNRVKGEVEQALIALAFSSLTIVRPGLIGGKRPKMRPAESMGMKTLLAIEPLLPRRYRVVPAERIARALVEAVCNAIPGVNMIESERI